MRKVLREDGHNKPLFTDRVFELQNVELAQRGEDKFVQMNALRSLAKREQASIEPLVSKARPACPSDSAIQTEWGTKLNPNVPAYMLSSAQGPPGAAGSTEQKQQRSVTAGQIKFKPGEPRRWHLRGSKFTQYSQVVQNPNDSTNLQMNRTRTEMGGSSMGKRNESTNNQNETAARTNSSKYDWQSKGGPHKIDHRSLDQRDDQEISADQARGFATTQPAPYDARQPYGSSGRPVANLSKYPNEGVRKKLISVASADQQDKEPEDQVFYIQKEKTYRTGKNLDEAKAQSTGTRLKSMFQNTSNFQKQFLNQSWQKKDDSLAENLNRSITNFAQNRSTPFTQDPCTQMGWYAKEPSVLTSFNATDPLKGTQKRYRDGSLAYDDKSHQIRAFQASYSQSESSQLGRNRLVSKQKASAQLVSRQLGATAQHTLTQASSSQAAQELRAATAVGESRPIRTHHPSHRDRDVEPNNQAFEKQTSTNDQVPDSDALKKKHKIESKHRKILKSQNAARMNITAKFQPQFGDHAIPTKSLGQIIDFNDKAVVCSLGTFNVDQAQHDSVGGFKPGRFDLQENYDKQHRGRVQAGGLVKPGELRNVRQNFRQKLEDYSKQRQGTQTHDRLPKSQLQKLRKTAPSLQLVHQVYEAPPAPAPVSSGSQNQRENVRRKDRNMDEMNSNENATPVIQPQTGSQAQNGVQQPDGNPVRHIDPHKPNPSMNYQSETLPAANQALQTRKFIKSRSNAQEVGMVDYGNINRLAVNQDIDHSIKHGGQTIISHGLQNIQSIQNMRRSQNMSQTSQRRTLQSQQNDESMTLFETHQSSPNHSSYIQSNRNAAFITKRAKSKLDHTLDNRLLQSNEPNSNGIYTSTQLHNIYSMETNLVNKQKSQFIHAPNSHQNLQKIRGPRLSAQQLPNADGLNTSQINQITGRHEPTEDPYQSLDQQLGMPSIQNIQNQTNIYIYNAEGQASGQHQGQGDLNAQFQHQKQNNYGALPQNFNASSLRRPEKREDNRGAYGPNTNLQHRQQIKSVNQLQMKHKFGKSNQSKKIENFIKKNQNVSKNAEFARTGKGFNKKDRMVEGTQEIRPKDFQEQVLDPENLRKFWDKEFDRQIRRAKLLEQTVSVSSGGSDSSDDAFEPREEREAEPVIHAASGHPKRPRGRGIQNQSAWHGKDDNELLPDGMGDEARAQFEQALRDRIVEGIDTFLTQANTDSALADYRKDDFSIAQLEGADPEIKKAMFTQKMYQKFSRVSDQLISSYMWELKREKVIPKDPKAYRQMLMDELEINQDKLVTILIGHLDDQNSKKNEELMKEKILDDKFKTEQNRNNRTKSDQEADEIERITEDASPSNPLTRSQSRTSRPNVVQTAALRRENLAALEGKGRGGHLDRMRQLSVLRSMSSSPGRRRGSNKRARLRNKKNDEFIKKLAQFGAKLLDEYFDMDQEIKDRQKRRAFAEDPTLAAGIVDDMNEVLESNLEEIMVNSEVHDNVVAIGETKKQLDDLQESASKITFYLRGKAEAQRADYLKSQKRLRDAGFLQMFLGQSRDALVIKFIQKLKEAVQRRKDPNAQKTKENFIRGILRKHEYNNQMKHSEPKTGPKQKNRRQAIEEIQRQVRESQNDSGQLDTEQATKLEVGAGVLQEKQAALMDKLKGGLQAGAKQASANALASQLTAQQREKTALGVQAEVSNKLQGMMRAPKQRPARAAQAYEVWVTQSTQGDPSEADEDAHIDDDNVNADLEGDAGGQKEKPAKRRSPTNPKIAPMQQGEDATQARAAQKALKRYIQNTLSSGQPPLPILNRISDGYLPLVNYQLNDTNSQSLARAMVEVVPALLSKMYLVNNSLKDASLAAIFHGLSQTAGLRGLGVLGNGLGPQSYECLATHLVPSKGFRALRKLVLKDPNPVRIATLSLSQVLVSLSQSSEHLGQLRVLVLSRLGMDSHNITCLGDAVQHLPGLQQLDISANGLQAGHLTCFLGLIHGKNELRSLNIAYNSGARKRAATADDQARQSFEDVLSNFLHYSPTLIHFDMSGLGLSFESLKSVALYGIRKSRTLQAVHMSGMGLTPYEQIALREFLRVTLVDGPQFIEDERINRRVQIATVDMEKVKEVFHGEPSLENEDFLGKSVKRAQEHLKLQVKESIGSPILTAHDNDKIVFQRNLGNLEMPNAHRWTANFAPNCHICSKLTYTVFVWNKKLALSQERSEESVQRGRLHRKFYKRSNIEPFKLNNEAYEHPLLSIGNKIYQMLPLIEFIERLKENLKSNVRNCDNEIEEQRHKQLHDMISPDFEQNRSLKPTYWEDRQALTAGRKPFNVEEINGWYQKVAQHLPQDASLPISLQAYGQEIESQYWTGPTRWEDIAKDTYICALYLPKKEIDFIIKHKDLPGINYLRAQQQNQKHLSINSIPLSEKRIRKVKEIRHFSFPKSVFCKFVPDTAAVIHGAFEHDKELAKLPKFVKDPGDLAKTWQVFKDDYGHLKNQFVTQIANPKSYPVIDWLDFVDACSAWQLVDKLLTSQDIDRIFIATNFEEEDLEENDDNSLCRFEFMEIIARMAKTKYFDKGVCKTVWESCRKMLREYIIPNTVEVMEWQGFRDNQLWCLDVDDLFKANQAGVAGLWRTYGTNGKGKNRLFSKDDGLRMLADAAVPLADKKAVLAYALSKQTVANEMGDFDKYNQMNLTEFHEYLGRLAALLYSEAMPLAKKLERLLNYLLPLIKMEYTPPNLDQDIESESDYDDDWVSDIMQSGLRRSQLGQEETAQEEVPLECGRCDG